MSPTTSYAAIRDRWVTLIQNLTPIQATDTPFEADYQAHNFLVRALENPQSALRRFAIRRMDGRDEVGPCDATIERVTDKAELIVAYPHNLGFYGPENLRDLDDLVYQDAELIRDTIGDLSSAHYLDGQILTRANYITNDDDSITLLTFTLEVTYYRSIS